MTPQPFRPACLLPFVLLLLRARGEISGQAIASAVRRLWSPNVSGVRAVEFPQRRFPRLRQADPSIFVSMK